MTDQLLRIGQLASQAGVSTRTVDYYTTLGLLTPVERSPGNFRLYDPAAIDRIALIRQLEAHGVSLDDIAKALNSGTNADVAGLLRQLDADLRELQGAAQLAGPEVQGLLAAITARAQSLIATALEIAAGIPGVPPV